MFPMKRFYDCSTEASLWHIYRKLGVNNRRAAVTLARALGLLAATSCHEVV